MKRTAKTMCFLLLSLFFATAAFGASTLKIGSVGPLTGESSIGGLDELDGKKLAIDDINNAGGLLGKKVELVSYDDASQPSQSASAIMKLINQDRVVAIIGAHNSSCTLANMEVITRYGIPMVTPGSSSPKVTDIGNMWITRAFPSDSIQAKAIVNFALDNNAKKLGIIYVNDDFGNGGLNAVTAGLKEKGIDLAGAESFMGADKDMRSQLTKLKALGVDSLFIWCQYFPGSLIMKQAREIGWNVQFYTSTGCVHPKTFELAGEAYEGTYQTVPFIPNIPEEKIQAWVKRYQEKYGKMPSQNSARAYDATMLALNAIKRAGTTDPKAIRDAIRSTKDFEGLQGKISIDSLTGEYIGDVMIIRAEKGDYTFIKRTQ
ncbi:MULTISPECIES: ABC transporter substrate-binding protein [Aminobacterium]|jgi:branched-chain amino acid transport system substrate-binding protein|uniref:ABC transporter substrate-binding protein n=1 Tax=Aminobacterium TaxID=81466 RepID=UPI00235451C1|nr:ABC transporter substrate-binding protein [Aminobacterium sp. UBA4987]